jgi:hypothetical protein
MLSANANEYVAKVMQWKKEGVETSVIISRLKEQNLSESFVEDVMKQWKKIRYEKQRTSGLIFCGLGGCLLVLSFAITLALFDSAHSFSFFLYGFTLLGISLLLKGMVDLLGW